MLKRDVIKKTNGGNFGALVQESMYHFICKMRRKDVLRNTEGK